MPDDPHSLPGSDAPAPTLARARDAHRSMRPAELRGAPGRSSGSSDALRRAPPLPPRLGGRDSQHDGDGEAAAADSDADEGRCLGALCDRRPLARDDVVFAM